MKAISDYNLPPFIDGSCRREPDFESRFPSITSLCRGGKFAPKLLPGDLVIYMTTKGKWLSGEKHRRLVGILKVLEKTLNQYVASEWYSHRGLTLSSNCLDDGNSPMEFSKTTCTFLNKIVYLNFLQLNDKHQILKVKELVSCWDELITKS